MVLVKPYVKGNVPTNGYMLTLAELRQLGRIFANIHTTRIEGIKKKNLQAQVKKTFTGLNKQSREYQIAKETKEILNKSGFTDEKFPQGFIHADLHTENIVISKGKIVAVLDFEESCKEAFIYDLGLSILDTCVHKGNINMTRLNALITGYESIRKLTDKEKEYIPQATLFAGLYVLHFLVKKNGVGHKENIDEQLAARFLKMLKRESLGVSP